MYIFWCFWPSFYQLEKKCAVSMYPRGQPFRAFKDAISEAVTFNTLEKQQCITVKCHQLLTYLQQCFLHIYMT